MIKMAYRVARKEDIDFLVQIVKDAKAFMKENGFEQWTEGYPTEEHILEDIKKEECYLWEEEGKICGMMTLSFEGEVAYEGLQKGVWNTGSVYGTIHRFAVSKEARGRGISGKLIQLAEQLCKEQRVSGMRVDTHRKNNIMKKFLKSHGYQQCGIICYDEKEDGERVAYDKQLN